MIMILSYLSSQILTNYRFIRGLMFHLMPPQLQVALHLALAYNSCSFPITTIFFIYLFFCSTWIPVSALQVIQQSTGLDLGWQDDPCLPSPWEKIECEGSLIASLYVQSIHFFSLPFLNILVFYFIGDLISMTFFRDLSDINLRSISPTFGELLDLKTL